MGYFESLLPKLSLSDPAVEVCVTREARQKPEFQVFTLPVNHDVRQSPVFYHRRNIFIDTIAHLSHGSVLSKPVRL